LSFAMSATAAVMFPPTLLPTMATRLPSTLISSPWATTHFQARSQTWRQQATRRRSVLQRKTYGVALRGESRVTYHGNRPPGNHSGPRLAHPDPARELVHLLARGASIGRITQGHYFRGGQLLVGFLRTLHAAIRIVEIDLPPRIRSHPKQQPGPLLNAK
ncbi:MAG TPA: hypothetical protein VIT23_01540, partial [Terrimicrobiaceae bacterium]